MKIKKKKKLEIFSTYLYIELSSCTFKNNGTRESGIKIFRLNLLCQFIKISHAKFLKNTRKKKKVEKFHRKKIVDSL